MTARTTTARRESAGRPPVALRWAPLNACLGLCLLALAACDALPEAPREVDADQAVERPLLASASAVWLDEPAAGSRETIAVFGASAVPGQVAWRPGMRTSDALRAAGGLTRRADADAATLIRRESGRLRRYRVRLDAVVERGDRRADVALRPGDVLVIPERLF